MPAIDSQPSRLSLADAQRLVHEVASDGVVTNAETKRVSTVVNQSGDSYTRYAKAFLSSFAWTAAYRLDDSLLNTVLHKLSFGLVPLRASAAGLESAALASADNELRGETAFHNLVSEYKAAYTVSYGTHAGNDPKPDVVAAYEKLRKEAVTNEDEPLQPLRDYLEAHYPNR
jgi:hypothetical protein